MSKTPIISAKGIEKDYYSVMRVDAGLRLRLSHAVCGWFGVQPWKYSTKLWDPKPVLRGVDLDIYEDEVLAITGRSGAGKSTFLHLLGALDRPTRGEVLYRGQSIHELPAPDPRQLKGIDPKAVQLTLSAFRNQRIGFVFQFYHLFDDLDAYENVMLPARVQADFSLHKKDFGLRALNLLERVGLKDRLRHRPAQLSGGEQQRVAIARALLLEPEVLLCDEPTGNLDGETSEKVLEVLFELKADQGQSYVIVTHDEEFARRADRHVVMRDGRIFSDEHSGKKLPKPEHAGTSEEAE